MWCTVLWCTLFSVKSTQFFYFRSCKTIHHTTNGTHEITKKTRKTHLRSDLCKSRAARSRAWGRGPLAIREAARRAWGRGGQGIGGKGGSAGSLQGGCLGRGGVVFGKEWGRGRAREEGERKGPMAKGQQGLNARKSKGSRHTLGNSLKFATGPQARTIKMFAPRTGAPEGKYVSCSLAFRSSNSHD